ncbi:MAG: alpha-galactosidase [Oscillospiraceae bacterium]|nr:alpha-galactosidase [Oscillospiraceae bacterium]
MPIYHENGLFRLDTENSSYWLRVSPFGHLEHIHFGGKLACGYAAPLALKRTVPYGSAVLYSEDDPTYCLDTLCLEWSGLGKGDYRNCPCEVKMPDGSFVSDFVYKAHEITEGCVAMECLPSAYADADCEGVETLRIDMEDSLFPISLSLYYTVFPASNVISRRSVIKNNAEKAISLRKFMSMTMDMNVGSLEMHTFDGGWIREAHHNVRNVEAGMYVNSSNVGASSNRHNPGFLLSERGAGEDRGKVWGFNLVYSGSHYGAVEKAMTDTIRVMLGINPSCFDWTLAPGESFEAPEAVMSYCAEGFNGLRRNFHDFVNGNIVRGSWKKLERPVLANNWEAHFFRFTHGKLIRLARKAKKLGVELFVLDDGWFGKRDNDHAGLGDYSTNLKKLPRGVEGVAKAVRRLGMDFGLWFEPEMVNEDSDLYRAHPDWAIKVPGRQPAKGRNQLVLDLTRAEVRDYIVENVGRVMDSTGLKYVKWDYNRHISDAFSPTLDNQGEFHHRYILGLYDVLSRIFRPRPHVLLESCSSGGNRFDLGMLCFSPQIWASDDTDPIERLDIQGGLSYLYPQSTWGSHIASTPSQQTLRSTPLSTRFNVAAFGCFGLELDLKYLSRAERQELCSQIAYYKKHRRTFQYGQFTRRSGSRQGTEVWQVALGDESICAHFQRGCSASPAGDIMPISSLHKDKRYKVKSREQNVYLKSFGELIKHLLPFSLNPEGFIFRTANSLVNLVDGIEEYEVGGDMLMEGLRLENQFLGTGYHPNIRVLGDFGSSMYTIEEIKGE